MPTHSPIVKVKTVTGFLVQVTELEALRLRRLRRKYQAELIVGIAGSDVVASVYGREVFRAPRRELKRGRR